MSSYKKFWAPLVLLVAMTLAPAAWASIVVPGADGSDGIFNPNADVTIDLSLAATGAWDSPSPVAGRGVYDPEKWAVVFKYQRVIIRDDVTVTFKNHPSGAPVVWLVNETVTVDGTISLDGTTGHTSNNRQLIAAPPGGFIGGLSGDFVVGGSGFGPGGAQHRSSNNSGHHAGYATPGDSSQSIVYGNARIIPLIGGSGGGGGASFNSGRQATGGGSGGGAILLAAQQGVTVNGRISADSGNSSGANWYPGGRGSGGAIRIVTSTLAGTGQLRALGSSLPGQGRIRVEADSVTLLHPGEPTYTAGFPGETAQLWPDASAPSVRMVSLAGVPIPGDPSANLVNFSEADVPIATEDLAQLVIETTNVSQFADVWVRVTPLTGANEDYLAFFISTDGDGVSTWHADIPLEQGFSAIQVRVVTP